MHLAAAGVIIGVLLALPDNNDGNRGDGAAPDQIGPVVRCHLPVLRTLGVVLVVGAVRASRQVVIPLWGDRLGLDPAVTSVIFGISGAVDMLLFYPAGWAMDHFGRSSWVVLPSLLLLGLSHVLLPLAGSAGALTAVAMLMGFGNGIGSGIVMTIGADVSPTASRAVFLGAWRPCGDMGSGSGRWCSAR